MVQRVQSCILRRFYSWPRMLGASAQCFALPRTQRKGRDSRRPQPERCLSFGSPDRGAKGRGLDDKSEVRNHRWLLPAGERDGTRSTPSIIPPAAKTWLCKVRSTSGCALNQATSPRRAECQPGHPPPAITVAEILTASKAVGAVIPPAITVTAEVGTYPGQIHSSLFMRNAPPALDGRARQACRRRR